MNFNKEHVLKSLNLQMSQQVHKLDESQLSDEGKEQMLQTLNKFKDEYLNIFYKKEKKSTSTQVLKQQPMQQNVIANLVKPQFQAIKNKGTVKKVIPQIQKKNRKNFDMLDNQVSLLMKQQEKLTKSVLNEIDGPFLEMKDLHSQVLDDIMHQDEFFFYDENHNHQNLQEQPKSIQKINSSQQEQSKVVNQTSQKNSNINHQPIQKIQKNTNLNKQQLTQKQNIQQQEKQPKTDSKKRKILEDLLNQQEDYFYGEQDKKNSFLAKKQFNEQFKNLNEVKKTKQILTSDSFLFIKPEIKDFPQTMIMSDYTKSKPEWNDDVKVVQEKKKLKNEFVTKPKKKMALTTHHMRETEITRIRKEQINQKQALQYAEKIVVSSRLTTPRIKQSFQLCKTENSLCQENLFNDDNSFIQNELNVMCNDNYHSFGQDEMKQIENIQSFPSENHMISQNISQIECSFGQLQDYDKYVQEQCFEQLKGKQYEIKSKKKNKLNQKTDLKQIQIQNSNKSPQKSQRSIQQKSPHNVQKSTKKQLGIKKSQKSHKNQQKSPQNCQKNEIKSITNRNNIDLKSKLINENYFEIDPNFMTFQQKKSIEINFNPLMVQDIIKYLNAKDKASFACISKKICQIMISCQTSRLKQKSLINASFYDIIQEDRINQQTLKSLMQQLIYEINAYFQYSEYQAVKLSQQMIIQDQQLYTHIIIYMILTGKFEKLNINPRTNQISCDDLSSFTDLTIQEIIAKTLNNIHLTQKNGQIIKCLFNEQNLKILFSNPSSQIQVNSIALFLNKLLTILLIRIEIISEKFIQQIYEQNFETIKQKIIYLNKIK